MELRRVQSVDSLHESDDIEPPADGSDRSSADDGSQLKRRPSPRRTDGNFAGPPADCLRPSKVRAVFSVGVKTWLILSEESPGVYDMDDFACPSADCPSWGKREGDIRTGGKDRRAELKKWMGILILARQ